jgi:hypothetical protein
MAGDDDERQLRIDLMTAQIETLQAEREKLRAETDRYRQEIRMENRKFAMQFISAIAAALGAGAVIGGLVVHLLGK